MDTSSSSDAPAPQLIEVPRITATSAVRSGIDGAHVKVLAETLERCPPIVVSADGILVDGVHRLAAARRRGWKMIAAIVMPAASEADHLLAAARHNAAHGLPLSKGERRAAVRQLLALDATRSDRVLAEACGVSRNLVATLRRELNQRSGGASGHLNERERVGRDGRRYPSERKDVGPLAKAIVRLDPQVSVRALAGRLGVSSGTAHRHRADALARLRRERWWTRAIRRALARWRLWHHGRTTNS